MFNTFLASVLAGGVDKVVLVANHVVAAETQARDRLRPHAGRFITLHLDRWPAALPALPLLRFLVTPAGLFERCDAAPEGAADLVVRVDASNPAALAAGWAAGRRPRIDIDGDAQFAADLNWLLDNLRWDIEDDLARIVGPAPARQLGRAGAALQGGVRRLADIVLRRTGAATGVRDGRHGVGPGTR